MKWIQDTKKPIEVNPSGIIVLNQKDEAAYNEEYVRKVIRFVKNLHNVDHDKQSIRQESLGQTINIQDNQPSLLS